MLLRNGALLIIITVLLNQQISAQILKSYEAIAKDILKYAEDSKQIPEGYPRFHSVKEKLINLWVLLQVYPDRLPEGRCSGIIKIISVVEAVIANTSILLLIPLMQTLGRILETPVKDFLDQKFRELKEVVFDFIAKVISYGIPFLIKVAFNGILQALGSIAKPLFDILSPILGPLLSPVEPFLRPLFEFLTKTIKDIITGLYDALSAVVSWIIYAIIKIIKWIGDVLGTLFDWIKKPFSFIIDPIFNFISKGFENLGAGIFKLIGSVGDGAGFLGKILENTIVGPIKQFLNIN